MDFGKIFAGLFRKKPKEDPYSSVPAPAPGVDPSEYVGFDPNVPNAPAPPGLPQPSGLPSFRSPELDQLFGDYNKAKDTIAHPVAKADPTEEGLATLLSAFAGSGAPLTTQKLFAAPQLNAQRAEQSQQDAAAQVMKTTPQLISAYLDRDTQTAKIAADIQKTGLNNQAKQQLGLLRSNVQVGKQIAQLAGEGKLTLEGATQLLQSNGIQDPQQAQATAQAMLQDLQANPSAWVGLQQGKEQLGQDKLRNDRITKSRAALTAVNGTPESRISAMLDLADAGDPLFQGMSYRDIQEAATHVGAQTQHVQEQTKTESEMRPGKVANLLKQGNYLDARTEAAKAQTTVEKIRAQFLPAEMQAKIHQANAAADKSERAANDAVYGVHNKPLTETAYFNAKRTVTTALGEQKSRIAMADQETAKYQAKLDAVARNEDVYDSKGEKLDPSVARQQFTDAINDVKSSRVYYEHKRDQLQSQLEDIEKIHSDQTKPVTLGPLQGPIAGKQFKIGGKTVTVTQVK